MSLCVLEENTQMLPKKKKMLKKNRRVLAAASWVKMNCFWSENQMITSPLSSLLPSVVNMVARWFIFKPKIPIWVNF
jgi:hypothetical protein